MKHRGGPRRGLRREEAAQYISVSANKFSQLVEDGRMPPPIKIDGCVVWDIVDLDRSFDALKQVNPWDEPEPETPAPRERRKAVRSPEWSISAPDIGTFIR